MSPCLPPIDAHAHIAGNIDASSLESLGAVVVAATRSVEEFDAVATRSDAATIWGLGLHPGSAEALFSFEPDIFAGALSRAVVVSEVGLDGRARTNRDRQVEVFETIAALTVDQPRIVSVHSSNATGLVLDVLHHNQGPGRVLHWWRGDERETSRAVDLGCFFSVNPASRLDLSALPLDRLLTETDHPFGNRKAAAPRQPGAIEEVERAIAAAHQITPSDVRHAVWENFAALVGQTGTFERVPAVVQRMLSAARRGDAPQ